MSLFCKFAAEKALKATKVLGVPIVFKVSKVFKVGRERTY